MKTLENISVTDPNGTRAATAAHAQHDPDNALITLGDGVMIHSELSRAQSYLLGTGGSVDTVRATYDGTDPQGRHVFRVQSRPE
ncbi:MAG TPA: hypothetical protein VHQ65_00940 [Thermoanaerobaculia bacterium]|nr:hypothetical protein [Thermoanaerobaculia bacterium]